LNAERLIAALKLPAASRVDQRVPKKLLVENGAPTATDKRFIGEGVDELLWLAALKPTTIGVPGYKDDTREYLEIAVLHLTLRSGAKTPRLVELVHRAVPYPVLLVSEQADACGLSAVHLRGSQGEAGKTVLDGTVTSVDWTTGKPDDHEAAFQLAMALDRQPRSTLFSLYQGWIDTLVALQAARVTGSFTITTNTALAAARRDALQEGVRLEQEIVRIRVAAERETQLSRRVDLNMELKRLEAAQRAARANL
jgi:hypothetical protein